MSIALGSNFLLGAGLPLDARSVVGDSNDRDAIPSGQRYIGMIVSTTQGSAPTYQLKGGITNSDWIQFAPPQLTVASGSTGLSITSNQISFGGPITCAQSVFSAANTGAVPITIDTVHTGHTANLFEIYNFGTLKAYVDTSGYLHNPGIKTASADLILNAASSYSVRFQTGSNTERLTIDSSGLVGIGNTSPTYFLDIVHSSTQAIVSVANSNASGAASIIFKPSNSHINYEIGAGGASLSAPYANNLYLASDDSSGGNDIVMIGRGSSSRFRVFTGGDSSGDEAISVATTGQVDLFFNMTLANSAQIDAGLITAEVSEFGPVDAFIFRNNVTAGMGECIRGWFANDTNNYAGFIFNSSQQLSMGGANSFNIQNNAGPMTLLSSGLQIFSAANSASTPHVVLLANGNVQIGLAALTDLGAGLYLSAKGNATSSHYGMIIDTDDTAGMSIKLKNVTNSASATGVELFDAANASTGKFYYAGVNSSGGEQVILSSNAIDLFLSIDDMTTTSLQIDGADGGIRVGKSSGKVSFYGAATVAKQNLGGAITNSIASGGSAHTFAGWTDLTLYVNDSAAIRNTMYQMAEEIRTLKNALIALNLIS